MTSPSSTPAGRACPSRAHASEEAPRRPWDTARFVPPTASGAAEPPLPRGVLLARGPQVPPVEVRPEGVEEDELGVRGLPEQEVARAVLPRAAHEQVDVGHVRLVEEPGDRRLVDLVGDQPAGGRPPGS